MPRPIRFRYRWEIPAQRVFETMIDREYPRARLDHLGGKGAALLKPDPDDLVIERTEITHETRFTMEWLAR